MKYFLLFSSLTFIWACSPPGSGSSPPPMQVVEEEAPSQALPLISLDRDQLYDKVLGMLVGSAIGDAMGAPTEMWSRYNIQVEYGHVNSLDAMVREPSPEGTWGFNLPAGGTTDDTRWKVLLGDYLVQQGASLYEEEGANPFPFARFVVAAYEKEIQGLKETKSFDPVPFEQQARRMAWLQEWAIVAKAFEEKEVESYSYALNRFYGGEMTCAGMLYSPMIGLAYPGDPQGAYKSAYRLGIFDVGYARDITALTASLVAAAMDPSLSSDSVLAVLKDTDPMNYFHSRLVGRASYRVFRDARYITFEAQNLRKDQVDISRLQLPFAGRDTLRMARIQKAYEMLDQKNQDMPFHAAEIHLINLTALMFSDFEFLPALEFVINYGRDNDTVGAITGAILGAYHGFNALSLSEKQVVLTTNRDRLGIDLEQVAEQLTEMMINAEVVSLPAP